MIFQCIGRRQTILFTKKQTIMKTSIFNRISIAFYYSPFSIIFLGLFNICQQSKYSPQEDRFPHESIFNCEDCVESRLCAIYGGTPDVTIGSDITSDQYISEFYTADGNGLITPPTGERIEVHGTLHIDRNFRGNSLIFQMGDGARIIIESSVSFYTANCKFFSCNDMWRGIEAPAAKSISLILCKIEDAEYALSVGAGTVIGLLNNEFTLNFVGFKNLGNMLRIGACFGNTFRGDEDLDLRPYYNNDDEILDHYDSGTPYAGFLLTDCATTIGRSNGAASFTFTRVVHGAKIINTTMTIQGATFNLIYGTELDVFESSGIYAEGSNLTSNKNTFTDNYFSGIYAYGSRMKVENCIFTHCCFGIFSEYNVMGEMIEIRNNIFNMNSPSFQVNKTSTENLGNYGILLSRSAGGSGPINKIDTNIFYIGGNNTNAFSAHISETSTSYGGEEIQFRGNRSNITSTQDMVCGYKIRCYNSNYITVDQDSFYFNNSSVLSMRNGISAQSLGVGHNITNNHFESASNRTMNIGFHGSNFANVYYCDNYFKYPEESFYFEGNCDRSSLATSTFANAFRGVYIKNRGIEKGRIGKQDRRGNQWDCTIPISSWAAYNEATFPYDSKFWIETTNCIRYPTTGIFPSDLFGLSMETTANDCSVSTLADSCGNILGFSAYDWRIVNGEYPEDSSQALADFNADYRLLERLILHPRLLNCDTTVQNYWNNKSESTAAELAGLLVEIREAIKIPDSIQTELNAIAEEENEIYNSMDTLFENHNWQDSLGLDSLFQLNLADFLNELYELKEDRDSLLVEIEDLRFDLLEDLEDDNDNISTDSIWETNLKTMNTFIIHLLIGTADSTDYANVAAIVDQDFGEGGPAVLHARVWFDGEDEEESLRKNRSGIAPINSKYESSNTPLTDRNFEVYPNPANSGQLTIKSVMELIHGQLLDVKGRSVKSFNMDGTKEFNMSVNELKSGLYLLRCEFMDGSIKSQRVFIP